MEIFPSGSFPDFPKFSWGNFPGGKFPGFPEILRGEVSRRKVSRIFWRSSRRNFPVGKFPGFSGILTGKFSPSMFNHVHTFPMYVCAQLLKQHQQNMTKRFT